VGEELILCSSSLKLKLEIPSAAKCEIFSDSIVFLHVLFAKTIIFYLYSQMIYAFLVGELYHRLLNGGGVHVSY